MKVVRYEFSEGFVPQAGAKLDPDVIGSYLEKLRKVHKGELLPSDLVADAKKSNSPLHPCFEWDDSIAGERFRLQQARGLIRSVVAVYRPVETEPKTISVRAYTHISEKGQPHYRATDQAMSQKITRIMIVKTAWDELQQWRRRYRDLKEFAALFEEIDQLNADQKLSA